MLFVSCQPYENEDYYTIDFILKMANAAKLGGAKGLRIEGIENITYIKNNIDLPIIGIIKKRSENKKRYITPTIRDIDELIKTKCEYIALDFTLRDDLMINDYFSITKHIHNASNVKIVADVSNIEEAKLAWDCHVDFVSSTLRGYTNYTKNIKIPDMAFIKQMKDQGIENIIAEGGYSDHKQYNQALRNGAKIVVIGTAITKPHLVVKKIITGSY